MFPETEHEPTFLCKILIRSPIFAAIPDNLCVPKCEVSFWRPVTLATPVPIATVNKNSDTFTLKDKVWVFCEASWPNLPPLHARPN
jgi:hypothetical protein